MQQLRKSCLLITFQAPRMPGGGGEVRSYNLVRTAAEVFDLTVLNIGGMGGDGRVPAEIRAQCRKVIEAFDFPVAGSGTAAPVSRLRAWLRLLSALAMPWRDHGRPYLRLQLQYGAGTVASLAGRLVRTADAVWSNVCPQMPVTCFMFDAAWRRIQPQALRLAATEKFDVVWVEHTLAWPFAAQLLALPVLRHVPVLCSGHNVEHTVCRRQADTESQPRLKQYYRRQAAAMRRMELRAWRRSQLILQCSSGDAQLTRRLVPQAAVEVLGNGVDGRYFQPDATVARPASPQIVFTAGFGYQPNVEAVTWFLSRVLPLIRLHVPQAGFLFAGSEAQRLAESLSTASGMSLNGVEWISDPVDIRPAFGRGLVYVVPLLCGGGSRLKILEAMSMRVPVVSTSVGAEGVPYEDGKHLLLADGAEAFAAAVVRLLQDAQLRQRLTEQAAEFVREAWDWSTLCAKLRNVLQKEFCQ